MNIRVLLPLALLSSALALSACGNKGPLLPPPAPEEDEWPEEQVDDADVDGEEPAVDQALDVEADAEADVDGEGDDPAPVDDDGGGGA